MQFRTHDRFTMCNNEVQIENLCNEKGKIYLKENVYPGLGSNPVRSQGLNINISCSILCTNTIIFVTSLYLVLIELAF